MSESSTSTKTRLSLRTLAAVLIIVVQVTTAFLIWSHGRRAPHGPAVSSARLPRVSQQRCAECHSEITDAFQSAPHARTLRRASDGEIAARFAGRSFHREDTNVDYRYELRDGHLQLSTPAFPRELPIHWIFGSGTHAQTPLITWSDDEGRTTAIEHSVSWYPPDQLGVTLGMDVLKDSSGVQALGRHWGFAETINCFGCHCDFVPIQAGRIDFERLQPNIGCARCHWKTAAHVDEMDRGRPASIERFSQLTPRESVDRCGECHRRASEMGGEITADNKTIVRFAPVGLVQSPCFQRQEEVILKSGQPVRLDCTTCHDPHRPTSRDWQFHARVCLTCHDAAHGLASDCPVATRQDNCLPCHMSAVPMNSQLNFTDHWIRIRKD